MGRYPGMWEDRRRGADSIRGSPWKRYPGIWSTSADVGHAPGDGTQAGEASGVPLQTFSRGAINASSSSSKPQVLASEAELGQRAAAQLAADLEPVVESDPHPVNVEKVKDPGEGSEPISDVVLGRGLARIRWFLEKNDEAVAEAQKLFHECSWNDPKSLALVLEVLRDADERRFEALAKFKQVRKAAAGKMEEAQALVLTLENKLRGQSLPRYQRQLIKKKIKKTRAELESLAAVMQHFRSASAHCGKQQKEIQGTVSAPRPPGPVGCRRSLQAGGVTLMAMTPG